MKKVIVLVCLLWAAVVVAAAEMSDAANILKKCDAAEGFNSYFAEMKQVITTTNGEKRTLVIRGWALHDGEKQLAEYLAPSDIKGQKVLMTGYGDNIWMFNPVTRRTRKLGSHMRKKKVMGSDFTYEDQAGGRMSKKYRGRILRSEEADGVPVWVLELQPTPEGPSYDKIIAWIGRDDSIVRRVDYFQDGGSKPFKRLIATDVRKAGEKKVPFLMTMTNLEDQTETSNVIMRIRFGVDLPESIFESRILGR